MHIDDEQRLLSVALGPPGDDRDQALERLIRYLEPVIRIRANRRLEAAKSPSQVRRADVDDLVQEVWLQLFADDFRVLRSWTPSRGRNLRSFVAMISTRFCIDLLRGRRLNPQREVTLGMEQLERDAGLVDELESRTTTRSFLEALVTSMRDILSKDGATLLQLMYLEGASPQEAAEQTGLPKTKIYNQRRRITELARKLARELTQGDRAMYEPPLPAPSKSQIS